MSDDVQNVKDRINIVDLVGQYVQLTRAGKNFHARCPFHKERTPSFNVSPERGTYMCFGCGEKGDIFSFVERIEGVDFKTALEELAQKAGVKLQRNFTPTHENREKDARLRDVCEAATIFFEETLQKRPDVEEYIRARAVSDETRKIWRLGYAPASWQNVSDHLVGSGFTKDEIVEAGIAAKSEKRPGEVYDRFRGRIMFPICDPQGRVVAFSGRIFEEMPRKTPSESRGKPTKTHPESRGEPAKTPGQALGSPESAKYVNSPETVLFKKSRILYGFDKAKNAIRKADCVLLVEGQFDVVLSHQSGLPFTVALSGTALTPEHLSLLGRLTKRLVLALDADQAGIRSGLRSAHMALSADFDVKVPTFPFGKDPADVARENPELLKAAIRTSSTAVEFFLDVLREPLSTKGGIGDGVHQTGDTERMYKRVVEIQVLPLIAAMSSKIEQEHFIRIVADRLNVSEAAVREEVAKRKRQDPPELPAEGPSAVLQEESLTAIEKKVAMVLFSFPRASAQYQKLLALYGQERLQNLQERLAGEAEQWRFRFESELAEHSNDVIAGDMLHDIERAVEKEQFRTRFS